MFKRVPAKLEQEIREEVEQRGREAVEQDRAIVEPNTSPITDAERAYWSDRDSDRGVLEMWGAVLRQAMRDRDPAAVKRIARALDLDAGFLLARIEEIPVRRIYIKN